jgi:CRP-like cAMP-binding protein
MVGVTRESINKWLRALERQGTVAQRRGRLVLLKPERLRDEIA